MLTTRRVINSVLVVLCCGFWLSCQASQQPQLEGDWVGGFVSNGYWARLNINFSRTRGSDSATADMIFAENQAVRGVALRALNLQSSHIHFEIPRGLDRFVFDGQLKDRTIIGFYRCARGSGAFGLTRVANIDLGDQSKFYGAYRITPNKVISIFGSPNPSNTLWYADYGSGQTGTLWPSAENTFFSGPGRFRGFPVALKATFIKNKNGEATDLLWSRAGEPEMHGSKIEFREEQVSFQNGNIKLAGTLILPSARSPHAVVIIVPGDFGTSKNYSRYWGHNFAARGIAVLIYDARGGGSSTGTAGNNPFGDLADDILAGVKLLKTKESVDPNRIGLFGFSNSAYFAALAASRSKDVSFLILKASSGVPPWQQETYRVERQLRLDGFSEEEIKEAVAFTGLKFEAARTGDGWEQLQAMSVKFGNERWFPYTNPPRSLERLRQAWEATFKYDPAPSFEKITCPVLLTYGEMDANVPVQQSISLLERALKKARNKDYTVKVFPKGRHDHLEGKDGSTFEAAQVERVVPNFWDTLAGWLLKRVNVKN